MFSWIMSSKLFPTKWSFFIFLSYMSLFICQGLLITSSRSKQGGGSSYPYNPALAVLASEALKLLISLFFQGSSKGIGQLCDNAYEHRSLLGYYFIPSFLYAIYNNLTFYNLSLFDPTSYFILLQIRLLLTGLIYQALFKKYLSRVQWLALLLLTLGCMIQRAEPSSANPLSLLSDKGFELLFILLQAFCSVFAGVYNEYIIKTRGIHVDISLQNVYMYADSILSNVFLVYMGREELKAGAFLTNLSQHTVLLWIIVNNALIGLVTSLFLKNLNSILKAFASALEIIFTAILGQVLLGIPIRANTSIAIAVVSAAIVIYARNPINSAGEEASGGTTKKELLEKV